MASKRRKTNRLRKIIIVAVILIIAIIAIIAMIIIKSNSNYDGNSLIGKFLYEKDGTIYEFKPDGKGEMIVGKVSYKFSYKTTSSEIEIDYEKDAVHDAKYTYEVKDGILTLVSTEGTEIIGEEFKLKKER